MSIDFIRSYLSELQTTLGAIPVEQVDGMIRTLAAARDRGAQLFVVGNGGSAALASHVAVDLGKCAVGADGRRFRVLSLTDNTPWITALANDVAYEEVFAEQLRNYAQPGDVLLAISGSGNSENVLRAVRYANSIGCHTLALAGFGGGRLRDEARECLVVQAAHMGRAEDAHLVVMHLVIYALMSA